ncbi:hypothetical protein K7X08_025016 [Anisodus acutangulus]|uniref:Uncharacterized protein n=1 Tax=Anisodus acutangulus TaxID=402998 RepID=A0A9Q1M8Z0_9SOLA|nr:hypothetical protein K7X08_025016 [Anisodus acutangulus]
MDKVYCDKYYFLHVISICTNFRNYKWMAKEGVNDQRDEEGGLNQQYEHSPSTVTGKDGDRTSKWDMEIYTAIKTSMLRAQ